MPIVLWSVVVSHFTTVLPLRRFRALGGAVPDGTARAVDSPTDIFRLLTGSGPSHVRVTVDGPPHFSSLASEIN
ncbi:hypothetical protein GCM10010405_33310 [Streptomyces macrosporus]|uniref:Uncharacterized protein n=1 Tax=Streptomyces macrosporus TaxID=44032 RepID=A0ABP5X715_9ACTN